MGNKSVEIVVKVTSTRKEVASERDIDYLFPKIGSLRITEVDVKEGLKVGDEYSFDYNYMSNYGTIACECTGTIVYI